jgi:hypothetical protein
LYDSISIPSTAATSRPSAAATLITLSRISSALLSHTLSDASFAPKSTFVGRDGPEELDSKKRDLESQAPPVFPVLRLLPFFKKRFGGILQALLVLDEQEDERAQIKTNAPKTNRCWRSLLGHLAIPSHVPPRIRFRGKNNSSGA